MPRPPRYLPRPGTLVEITHRTIQSRSLLRPSAELNEVVVGVLAKAQRQSRVRLHAVVFLSNHFHCLASFETVEQQAEFMCYLNTNLSKEIGRLHDWHGTLFHGRYKPIPVSDEPEAQITRLRYLLRNGTKEGLVLSPKDWPGVHSATALAESQPLRGVWYDRTQEYNARQRGETYQPSDFAEQLEVHLDPLPCWHHLPEAEHRQRVGELIEDIEEETLTMHRRCGSAPIGATAVLQAHPHQRPRREDRSIAPRFHAFRRKVRQAMLAAFAEFLAAYHVASERLKAGDVSVVFPANCYPPRLPFVPPTSLLDSS